MDRTFDIFIRQEDEKKTKAILNEFEEARYINWWRFSELRGVYRMCTFSYVLSDDIPKIINALKENGIQII